MHSIQSDKDVIRVFLFGKIDAQSLYDAQTELMLHPDYPFKNSLWVFDEGVECNFSNLSFLDLISRIKLCYPISATKEKAAFIGFSNTLFAMMQFFCSEAEHEGLPFKLKAFRNHAQAEAWLADV
jgi:hypothetical protein